MYIFLTVFLTLYGGMHWYWYRKAMPIVSHSAGARVVLGLLLIVMVLAPIMIRVLERWGYEAAARWTACIGYSWMGILFLSCSCFLVLDLARLLSWSAGRFGAAGLDRFLPGPAVSFTAITTLTAFVFAYGLYEAAEIRTETVDLYSTKIPVGAGTLTVAQISDVHLGLLVGEERLREILTAVRRAAPDILVATGDLVDGQMDGRGGLIALLQEIRPRYGKFAVTGNHELYVGSTQALSFLRDAGFTVLRGEAITILGLLAVAGVDDPVFGGKAGVAAQEREALQKVAHDRFVLLLKHRPVVSAESRGRFDLQLSGHVHQGQIFPFGLLTRLAFPLPTGLSGIEEGGAVYVSRGAGTWGPPIRFLAPPEVTVFRLRHPQAQPGR